MTSNLSSAKFVYSYFAKKDHKVWLLVILATTISAVTEPLIPALLKPLLDNGFKSNDLELWKIPTSIILIFLIRGFFSYLAQIGLTRIVHNGMHHLRMDMFNIYQRMSFKQATEIPSSILINKIILDIQNGATQLVGAILSLIRSTLTLVFLLCFLFYMNWKLTLLILCIFPLVGYSMKKLSSQLHKSIKDSQKATDELSYVIEENVLAIKEIRLYEAQKLQNHKFEILSKRLDKLALKATFAGAAMTPVTQLLAAISLSIVISYAIVDSAANSGTVGDFVAFITAMLMIITPLRQLSEVSNPITRGIALLNESKEFIETSSLEPSKTSPNIPHHHNNLRSNSLNGEIIFENVSFTYPGNQNPTLNLVSFEIKSGEHAAFIGSSGSGKTTIINLIPRFIERDQGHIYIDGILIDEYDIQQLRNKISLVSQNIILLNASVYDNICMSEEIDKDRVDQILTQLKLDDLIEKNYKRSSINLGHNSSLISGGQRQRIALARAIYRDSPILILDEATSSLDSETDEIIRLALSSYSQGKTIVSISHKLTNVINVNKIFLIENGAVVDSGTHHELMTNSSRYKYMFDKN